MHEGRSRRQRWMTHPMRTSGRIGHCIEPAITKLYRSA